MALSMLFNMEERMVKLVVIAEKLVGALNTALVLKFASTYWRHVAHSAPNSAERPSKVF
jgi:hypothetical protein